MHAAAVTPIETGTVILHDLPGTKYSLQRQITLAIEEDENGAFIVSEPTTGVFNYDANWSAAMDGFVRAFVNQFEFLTSKEANLSPSLLAELEQFRYVIIPRH